MTRLWMGCGIAGVGGVVCYILAIALPWPETPGLGPGWAIPSVALGIALIVLNAATFPWPPGDHGLIDIGPFIGLFVMALAARLTFLGRNAPG